MPQQNLVRQQREKILVDSKQTLTEGFNHGDMIGFIKPVVSIDEYSATMGDDEDVITLCFQVEGQTPAKDLVDWFERGYKWVLDSQVSNGAVDDVSGYLVFVELERRIKAVDQIIELIEDLESLSGIKMTEWELSYNDNTLELNPRSLRKTLPLSPKQYRDSNSDKNDISESLMRFKHVANLPETPKQPPNHFRDLDDDSEALRMVELYKRLM